jgi:trimeric autotransporter adhesin
MGYCSVASGEASTAMGGGTANGNYSIAMGILAKASGERSTAMGNMTTASGEYSTAMGCYASTGGKTGSMAIGDASTISTWTYLTNTVDNQWMARFAGGIAFFTNAATNTGVYMNGNTSGWTNFCDRNKKENFSTVDGEELLLKLRRLTVLEWNYKGTDASVRYVGPMAQDFWQAFRLGGTDSLGINSISIDGINMAAIKALEKRTAELKERTAEIALLKNKIRSVETEQARMAAQLDEIGELKKQLASLKSLLVHQQESNRDHALLAPGK